MCKSQYGENYYVRWIISVTFCNLKLVFVYIPPLSIKSVTLIFYQMKHDNHVQ